MTFDDKQQSLTWLNSFLLDLLPTDLEQNHFNLFYNSDKSIIVIFKIILLCIYTSLVFLKMWVLFYLTDVSFYISKSPNQDALEMIYKCINIKKK